MIIRRTPLQSLRRTASAHAAEGHSRHVAEAHDAEERARVPEFHMRGLFAVIPSNDISPLALRPSDVPREWRESDAA